jgi:hypothetical protein
VTQRLGLDDWFAIRELQARGMQLDLERVVLWPHTPLHAALSAYLPASKIGAQTVMLYPSATTRARAIGFLQMRHRRGRPEADVVFLAPALEAHEDAVAIWYRLLAECAQELGARGGQRLFAQITCVNGCEEVFRQAGFNAYAREELYCLDALPAGLDPSNELRHQRARDGWNLLRLYTELTPRPVQIAEGMLSPDGLGGKVGEWGDPSRGAGYVLESGGDLAGAVRIQRGQSAYWLRFGLPPQAHDHADRLLLGALALLRLGPNRPVYCGVRDYESGMSPVLEQAGFRHVQTRSLLVKHTTARIKEPFLKITPALEKQAKPAASVSQHSK